MADQTIQYTEEMVGSGHATKADTLNRHGLVAHEMDGTHKEKAWVYFIDVAGTPTIQASDNVTSITDNGTGDYAVNFTTDFSNANYAAAAMGEDSRFVATISANRAVGSFNLTHRTDAGTSADGDVSAIFEGNV